MTTNVIYDIKGDITIIIIIIFTSSHSCNLQCFSYKESLMTQRMSHIFKCTLVYQSHSKYTHTAAEKQEGTRSADSHILEQSQ